jgi:hypothetical protein
MAIVWVVDVESLQENCAGIAPPNWAEKTMLPPVVAAILGLRAAFYWRGSGCEKMGNARNPRGTGRLVSLGRLQNSLTLHVFSRITSIYVLCRLNFSYVVCCCCDQGHPLVSMKRAILRSDNDPFRGLTAATAAMLWIRHTMGSSRCMRYCKSRRQKQA